jgi:hypothetical protein
VNDQSGQETDPMFKSYAVETRMPMNAAPSRLSKGIREGMIVRPLG